MKIHFIGIGGIGMSALAQYFLAQGDEVRGSDVAPSEITAELEKSGVKIPPNPPFLKGGENPDLVIYSAAVREDDPELVEARRQGIKTQKYAEALGELTKGKYTIAVSGMHGKSTTTAMLGLVMEKAGLDPTVILGTKVRWNSVSALNNGIAEPAVPSKSEESTLGWTPRNDTASYSNFRAGQSKYLVIEADEYDRSFLNYWPKILVLLNIEEEHRDTYTGGLPDIMETFSRYIAHLPEDGTLIANEEDENINKLISHPMGDRPKGDNFQFKIITYNLKFKVENLKLKISGRHNLSNALAALTAARELGIKDEISIKALNEFSGTWRRMEWRGELNGAKIFDDYGHHPTEIKATLEGARELLKKIPPNPPFLKGGENCDKRLAISDKQLWCVFQPHQYHRTFDLFDKFVGAFGAADKVILLPVYSVAGREDEEIKKKVSSEKLAEAIKKTNYESGIMNQEILYSENFNKAVKYLKENLKEGDLCVIMGAGDVCKLTDQLIS